jgi:hypothetical protein
MHRTGLAVIRRVSQREKVVDSLVVREVERLFDLLGVEPAYPAGTKS